MAYPGDLSLGGVRAPRRGRRGAGRGLDESWGRRRNPCAPPGLPADPTALRIFRTLQGPALPVLRINVLCMENHLWETPSTALSPG